MNAFISEQNAFLLELSIGNYAQGPSWRLSPRTDLKSGDLFRIQPGLVGLAGSSVDKGVPPLPPIIRMSPPVRTFFASLASLNNMIDQL